MNDKQAEALGQRLVACDGFRWMPGMLMRGPLHHARGAKRLCGATEVAARMECARVRVQRDPRGSSGVPEWCWPDLRDPATLGCVLALVREKSPGANVQSVDSLSPGGRVTPGRRVMGRLIGPTHYTEAEALVAYMEIM